MEAIARRLEAIAIRLEVITIRLEAIATSNKKLLVTSAKRTPPHDALLRSIVDSHVFSRDNEKPLNNTT